MRKRRGGGRAVAAGVRRANRRTREKILAAIYSGTCQ